MNRKRNVQFTKPDDPEFLKVLKKQAGYDDRNHKFDKLDNEVDDFVDDEENEKPQVVVLKEGDLTAEEADLEQKRMDTLLTETKADLSKRVIFKSKSKECTADLGNKKHKLKADISKQTHKKSHQLLSFDDEEEDD
ncbi:uncharacterized protein KIAA1143 homolog [Plodia interpunctella]|uniref:uncharacterized protein KIAA1143 homolog n=1 Tax=Plodia interpunctella TaxID=58824 RepID=UPI0023674387|nr:uncharacterized protein KIAA1143 homolog [Plodia interpunctella]